MQGQRVRHVAPGGFLFLLIFASTAWAVPREKAVSPRIINGDVVTRVAPVVEVINLGGDGGTLCTGSVLTTTTILTASHCVSRSARSMRVMIDGKSVGVKRVRIHPRARVTASGLIPNDVALLSLKRKTSKPSLPILISTKLRPSDPLTILGFGLDEFGMSGLLREGLTTISRVSNGFIVTSFDSVSESNSCNGDSGGPALFTYTDASGVQHSGIVGVVSAGTMENCSFGDESFYVNLQSRTVLQFLKSRVRGLQTN